MKKSSFLLMCAGLLLANKSFAQKPCGTDEMRRVYIAQHPEILKYEADLEAQIQQGLKRIDLSKYGRTTSGMDSSFSANYWFDIPIVVHIVHDYNSSADYLTDDNIFNYLIDWNKVYAAQNTADTAEVIAPFKKWVGNPHIRLHLATIDPAGNPTKGITRHRSYLTYNGGDQAKYDDWDPASYVNIWSINKMSSANGDAAAYATPPTSGAAAPYRDGVIGLWDYMQNDASHPYSKTINHEMGHVFNLAHPWGSTNSPEAVGVTCSDGGSDNVDDTPPTLGHYPANCQYSAYTSPNPDNHVFYPQGNIYDTVCATNYFKIYPRNYYDSTTHTTVTVTDSLVNYPDTVNAQNIMDYTYCSKNFTKGQVDRMHAALHSDIGHRNNLWNDTNLIRTGVITAAPASPSAKVFVARPDLPAIPEFAATVAGNSASPFGSRNVQYFTKPGTSITFKNRTWNDTVSSLVWTFSNSASIPIKTDANPTYSTQVVNTFAVPGWVSLTMAATGNHTATVTKTWDNAVFVADGTATNGYGYYQEFDPAGDAAKWPMFNYYENEFKWETSAAGYYDNHCLKYTGFDSRLDFSMSKYPTVGSPYGDFDDFYSVPVNLSTFPSGPCNLNFFTSGASRSSNSLDITDTFEIAYSTDAVAWTKLSTIAKGDLANKGAVATPFTPGSMSDWVARTINIPTAARGSYVIFRFRYRPGVDHSFYDYSTGNNFYIDRIHFSAFPAEVSGVLASNNSITVAPNPTTGSAFVIIKDATNSTARIVVSDITGKVVYTTNQQVNGNEATIEIPAAVIAVKGIYLVQTSTGKEVSTQKLVVN